MTDVGGFGRQVCGNLAEATAREWLVADGLGGYAMGTVAGLRTRRYHGLLVVAGDRPGHRRLGLAALDPVLLIGDRRIRLAVHEWASGAVDPHGELHLASFDLTDGVPRWRWAVGDVVLEREIAMDHGRSAVGIVHRLVRAGDGPVRLQLSALCTWRDVHGDRRGDCTPSVASDALGFVFEGEYRVVGPGFVPGGGWYRDAYYREEAARGLTDREDLWFAGTFAADLDMGRAVEVLAWAPATSAMPESPSDLVADARERARLVIGRADARDRVEERLALAADQFVVAGPTVVAGYPWFGEWSRDAMISYEGLFLVGGRPDEGRALLERAAASLSEGMLPNTTDPAVPEYNTADATLWLLHAIDRHVTVTGDLDIAAALVNTLVDVVAHHVEGTRYGIVVDPADGLLTQGAAGLALTWMDATVNGVPVTPRLGKAVEINALWVNALAVVAGLLERLGKDASDVRAMESRARASFTRRFLPLGVVLDVVDGRGGDDPSVRPNQLLAVSLPHGPLSRGRMVVEACRRTLLTSLGLRSLAPSDPAYRGRHRGWPADRDRAYHEGTVWPWLIGPYVDAALRTGVPVDGVLDGLVAHLGEWGVGSVSETADGDPPHGATGCPFQAWSVAEVFRAYRRLGDQAFGGNGR